MNKLSALLSIVLAPSFALAAAPLKYETTVVTYACLTQNNTHKCERLKELQAVVELPVDVEVSEWNKWVKAEKFDKSMDFHVALRLRRNVDGVSHTLSGLISNPWVGTFDLGQMRMRLSAIKDAPSDWMLGSAEHVVEPGASFSVRMIFKRVP
jgi:hypothetical protein